MTYRFHSGRVWPATPFATQLPHWAEQMASEPSAWLDCHHGVPLYHVQGCWAAERQASADGRGGPDARQGAVVRDAPPRTVRSLLENRIAFVVPSSWRAATRHAAWANHGSPSILIWREQGTDDIGLDGEVELCRPRDDGGDGFVGTGKIVKVQSKSGSSYVIRDTDASFASPVAEKDLHY